jgi:hypothetical protein
MVTGHDEHLNKIQRFPSSSIFLSDVVTVPCMLAEWSNRLSCWLAKLAVLLLIACIPLDCAIPRSKFDLQSLCVVMTIAYDLDQS